LLDVNSLKSDYVPTVNHTNMMEIKCLYRLTFVEDVNI